jgi:hypothetical protein
MIVDIDIDVWPPEDDPSGMQGTPEDTLESSQPPDGPGE